MAKDEFYSAIYKLKIENLSDFKMLSETEKKAELIRKKIYIQEIEDEEPFFLDQSLLISSDVEDIQHFDNELIIGNFLIYNNEPYIINPEVYNEIYKQMRFLADLAKGHNKSTRKRQIEQTINLAANINEALSELKKQRENHLERYLSLLANDGGLLEEIKIHKQYNTNYDDEVIKMAIKETPELISPFIFDEYIGENHLMRLWASNITKEQTINIYTEKIAELNNKITKTSLSKLIFRDNGEEIFTCIVLNYHGKKNQAFYSYLYYFLKDTLEKIMLENEDSGDYKKYVIDNGYLNKYGRMQKPRSNSKKKHLDMPELFKKILLNKF